ncbi:MAG: hypothetical protein H0V34_11415 [Gammaproteobacteria bacterium]|nr:hypothetical protein [Gammaproteobacteria bacterium]
MTRTKAFEAIKDQRLIEATDLSRRMAHAKEHPKEFIWFGAHDVLVEIVNMHGYSDYKNWTKANQLFFEGGESEV